MHIESRATEHRSPLRRPARAREGERRGFRRVTDSTIIAQTTGSPALLAEQRRLAAQIPTSKATFALHDDRKLRDGLRFVAGLRGLFMPEPPTVDKLVALGLIEADAGGVSVGMADNYRPTGLGSELLSVIGVRG